MPFKSKAQRRWMYAAEARGELPKGTAERWEKHTKNKDKLPEKASSDSGKKSASRSASPVPGPDPGQGNILVKWPLVVNPNGKFGGKFILPAGYFGPNLLAKRLGKGPGSTQINSDSESPKLVHPMKIAGFTYPNAVPVTVPYRTILDFLKVAQGSQLQPAPFSSLLDSVQPPGSQFSGTGAPFTHLAGGSSTSFSGAAHSPLPSPPVVELYDHLQDVGNPSFSARMPGSAPPSRSDLVVSAPPRPTLVSYTTPQSDRNTTEQEPPAGVPYQNVSRRSQETYAPPIESLVERRFVYPAVDEEGNPIVDEQGNIIMDEPTLDFDVNWFRRTFGPHYGRLEVVLADALSDRNYTYLRDASDIEDRLYDLQSAQKRLEIVAQASKTYGVTPYELVKTKEQYERAKSRFLRSAQALEEDMSYMADKGFSDDFYGYILAKVEQQVDSYRLYNQKYAEYLEKVEEAKRLGTSPPPVFGLGRMLNEEDLRRRIDSTIQSIVTKSRTHFVRAKGQLKEYAWGLAQEALRRHGVNVPSNVGEKSQGGSQNTEAQEQPAGRPFEPRTPGSGSYGELYRRARVNDNSEIYKKFGVNEEFMSSDLGISVLSNFDRWNALANEDKVVLVDAIERRFAKEVAASPNAQYDKETEQKYNNYFRSMGISGAEKDAKALEILKNLANKELPAAQRLLYSRVLKNYYNFIDEMRKQEDVPPEDLPEDQQEQGRGIFRKKPRFQTA